MATSLRHRSAKRARQSIYSALPRLAVPRERARVVAGHFRRTAARVLVLLCADLAVLWFVWWADAVTPLGHVEQLIDPVFAVVIGLLIFRSYGRGDVWKDPGRLARGAALGVLASGWALLSRAPIEAAVPFLAFVWATSTAGLAIGRVVIASVVAYAKRNIFPDEKVLIVAPNEEQLDAMQERIGSRDGVQVVGRLLVSRGESDVWGALQSTKPDTVLIAGQLKPAVFTEVVRASALSGCYVLAVPRYERLGGLRPHVAWWGGSPLIELSLPELTAPQLAIKRVVDFVGATLGIVFLSPVFAAIAFLIKATSPGPVFFKQMRVGFGGGLFWMYKFRTMRADADELKQSLSYLNASGDRRLFKIPNDPRITPLGRVLRRWSLDELPQLINVIKGEMSLVGPRPFFEEDLEDYREEHLSRLAAKPGMTGLWQVQGRSSILDFEEVVRMDLEYVYRWSLWTDLAILLETLPAVLRRAGAQ